MVIPDIVFLILGLLYLWVLLSIRNELRKKNRQGSRRLSSWSAEDMLKHRVKYLRHCRHLERHMNNLKSQPPELTICDLVKN